MSNEVPDLRRDPASGLIYMHWTDKTPRGQRGRSRRRTTGTADMDEAKAFLGKFLLLEREQPAPGAALTVADLWAVYEQKHVRKHVASPETVEWSWKNLSVKFGSLALSEVSQDVVDEYEDARLEGDIGRPSEQSTVRRELAQLRACFNWCVDRKIVAREHLPSFDLPPEGEARDRWLRTEEVQKLLEAARAISRKMDDGGRMGRGERFLWLGLETAARSTAIRELTWDRVDFATRAIDYNVPGRKKTKKRRAVVPISSALLPVLERMREEIRDTRTGYVLDSPAPVRETIKRIAKNAKVADVTPHVLRHTAATHMARRSVPLWIIAKVLGNTLAMVERVYAKHSPEDLRAAVDTISEGVTGVGL